LAFGNECEDFALPARQLVEGALLIDDPVHRNTFQKRRYASPKLIYHKLQCRLDPLGSRFSVLGSLFGVLGSRFSVLGSYLGVLGSYLGVLDSHFGVLDSHFGLLDSRLGLLDSSRDWLRGDLRLFRGRRRAPNPRRFGCFARILIIQHSFRFPRIKAEKFNRGHQVFAGFSPVQALAPTRRSPIRQDLDRNFRGIQRHRSRCLETHTRLQVGNP
jgi:hypothetical protein